MNFTLTKEQALIQKMIRSFTENEVKPIAAEIDRNHTYPAENIAKLFKLGVMGMVVPKQYGGQGGGSAFRRHRRRGVGQGLRLHQRYCGRTHPLLCAHPGARQ